MVVVGSLLFCVCLWVLLCVGGCVSLFACVSECVCIERVMPVWSKSVVGWLVFCSGSGSLLGAWRSGGSHTLISPSRMGSWNDRARKRIIRESVMLRTLGKTSFPQL